MIKKYFGGWSTLRWLRLLTGIIALTAGLIQKDMLLGVLGGFLTLTSLTNKTACCGSAGCKTKIDS